MVKAGSIYIGFGGVGPSPCSATISVWGDLGQSLSSPASCSPLLSGRKDRGMTQRVCKCLVERMLHRHKGAQEARTTEICSHPRTRELRLGPSGPGAGAASHLWSSL